ncbi:MAG: LysM peptidoglycan-binding domain-containing protein [Ardenticatenaceae bacterium]|nr:LysM peptidoglycan-binding domain-containing protein [Anaerolineales bacterium]MCB8922501.1 LysM peptidoglycan-binding domain-containing protein [Ardenticatenaceae bacterium]MCB8989970.1 LysM peptidoglycan-binding domain-containing protein [Ardenticatenaceae bacterium]MCB9005413.1 LysM peptidoglycan-binding domain-containing protein [Ardenticatenaceae bacterium]
MSFRRMLPFILINIVVSAVVVLGILYWWDSREQEPEVVAQATAVAASTAPAATAAALVEEQTQAEEEPSATPEPEDELPVHVVRSGDTLMSISQFYDIPMDDLIAFNNLDNPNLLAVGQELVIPVNGIPTPTPPPTATPEPNVLPSPNPTIPAEEEGVVDLQITAVYGLGDLTEEAVQLINAGSRIVELQNWNLRDEDGYVYTFINPTALYGDGSGIVIHTEAGQDTSTDLYWDLEEPIWQSGERVTLLDAEGTIQATFTIP